MAWVILTDDHPPLEGGVSTWVDAVAGALHARGEAVRVLARARPGLGGRAWPVVGVRGPSFGRWGHHWTALAALTQVRRDDRVIAATWPVARTVARRRHRELHVVFHGSDLTRAPGPGFARVCDAATHRWTVSGFLQECLARRGYRGEVLPAPIDVLDESPASPGAERWLYVARATALKGGDRFVRLVAAAGVHGVVIGEGPALSHWRALAADLGAHITFLGAQPRSRVLAEMRAADRVLLLPRVDADGGGAEGLGLVLLEAHALGVPVVGCRTGGVPEAVGPGLVLDAPDDVATAVAAIVAHRSDGRSWLRARHGAARTAARLVGES